jgi:hypothetical protein
MVGTELCVACQASWNSLHKAVLIKFCIVEIGVAFFVCTYLWIAIETRPSLFVCQESRNSLQKELTDVKECFLAYDVRLLRCSDRSLILACVDVPYYKSAFTVI